MTAPRDHILCAAFERGRTQGKLQQKWGHTQCPYGPSRPWQRDAWFAGYDYGWKETAFARAA